MKTFSFVVLFRNAFPISVAHTLSLFMAVMRKPICMVSIPTMPEKMSSLDGWVWLPPVTSCTLCLMSNFTSNTKWYSMLVCPLVISPSLATRNVAYALIWVSLVLMASSHRWFWFLASNQRAWHIKCRTLTPNLYLGALSGRPFGGLLGCYQNPHTHIPMSIRGVGVVPFA